MLWSWRGTNKIGFSGMIAHQSETTGNVPIVTPGQSLVLYVAAAKWGGAHAEVLHEHL